MKNNENNLIKDNQISNNTKISKKEKKLKYQENEEINFISI